MNEDINGITLNYLSGSSVQIEVHGIKIVSVERNLWKMTTEFYFENGWVIEMNLSHFNNRGGPDGFLTALVHEIETRLRFIDPMTLEAFGAPEVLEDEEPAELDPDPCFLCHQCGKGYRYESPV